MKNKYYITTPIYYPNDKLHLGHCYTTIICDIFKKYQTNILNNDCFFITGSDEHGQKIAKSAMINNTTPKEYVDKIVNSFQELWKLLNIDYDKFIRTTDKNHINIVQEVFEILWEKKLIYLDKYQTNYCEYCEEAFTNSELVDKKCPKCQRLTILLDEESYFLKCKEFQNWIQEVFHKNLIKIMPENKKNEMVNNFLNDLKDLSISRTNVKWAIPIKSNDKHTIYVWLDALLNYISVLNYLAKDDQLFQKYWAKDCQKIHIIGKEIARFHTIYWPIILKSLDLELPNEIICHGWIVASDNQKMSKSLNNYLNPLDVIAIHNNSDVLRYYLAKIAKIGDDFYFNLDHYNETYNNDLANNVGNLVSRVFTMIEKYLDGEITIISSKDVNINNIYQEQKTLIKNYQTLMEKFAYKDIIEQILEFIFKCNKLIENYKPWALFKNNDLTKLNELLSCLSISTILVMYLLSPIIPKTYNEFLTFFKIKNSLNLDNFLDFKKIEKITILEVKPLFNRK